MGGMRLWVSLLEEDDGYVSGEDCRRRLLQSEDERKQRRLLRLILPLPLLRTRSLGSRCTEGHD